MVHLTCALNQARLYSVMTLFFTNECPKTNSRFPIDAASRALHLLYGIVCLQTFSFVLADLVAQALCSSTNLLLLLLRLLCLTVIISILSITEKSFETLMLLKTNRPYMIFLHGLLFAD